jgi:nitroreductase
LASQDRTAPSWRHTRETEVFAVMANGTWRYDPIEHRLMAHLTDDIRGETGTQSYAAGAPLHLIYVSDAAHMSGVARDEQRRFAAADAGFIGQNVYLYCASEGLACVFRTAPEQDRLVHAMKLAASQFVEFAQTVGYPKG